MCKPVLSSRTVASDTLIVVSDAQRTTSRPLSVTYLSDNMVDRGPPFSIVVYVGIDMIATKLAVMHEDNAQVILGKRKS